MNNKWPWSIPTHEFHPIGDEKLHWLREFIISRPEWSDNGRIITSSDVLDEVYGDRRFASKVYTAYKLEIDELSRYWGHDIKKARASPSIAKPSYSQSPKQEPSFDADFIKKSFNTAMENEKIAIIAKKFSLKRGHIEAIGAILLKMDSKKQLTIPMVSFAELLHTKPTWLDYGLRELERNQIIKRTRSRSGTNTYELIALGEDCQFIAPCMKLERFKPKKKDKDRPIPTRPAKVLAFKQKV